MRIIPGNINSNGSKGTNKLIKYGAKLVEGVGDILEEFDSRPDNSTAATNLSKEEASVMDVLTEPVQIDEIASLSGMDVRSVSAILLNLELSGIVRQLPGMVFVKNI